MSFVDTLRSAVTTGLRLPFGVGIVGPSGIHGRTFARRIGAVTRLAERLAARHLDPASAREIAQDVAVAVWEQLARDESFLDGSRPIPPIIYSMVRQRLIKRARSMSRQLTRESLHMEERSTSVRTWMDPLARLEEFDMAELNMRATSRLSRADREVLALCREEGLSYREIAERLGKSMSTVRQQMISAMAVYREECRAMGVAAPSPRGDPARVVRDSADRTATAVRAGDVAG